MCCQIILNSPHIFCPVYNFIFVYNRETNFVPTDFYSIISSTEIHLLLLKDILPWCTLVGQPLLVFHTASICLWLISGQMVTMVLYVFSVFGICQTNNKMPRCGFICSFLYMKSIEFLKIGFLFFYKFWKIVSHHFFKYCIFLPFGVSITYMLNFCVSYFHLPHVLLSKYFLLILYIFHFNSLLFYIV